MTASLLHQLPPTDASDPAEHLRQLWDIKKYASVKVIEVIWDIQQESRKELFLWLFERAGRKNSNNKKYQFWQQHSHPVELSTNEMTCPSSGGLIND